MTKKKKRKKKFNPIGHGTDTRHGTDDIYYRPANCLMSDVTQWRNLGGGEVQGIRPCLVILKAARWAVARSLFVQFNNYNCGMKKKKSIIFWRNIHYYTLFTAGIFCHNDKSIVNIYNSWKILSFMHKTCMCGVWCTVQTFRNVTDIIHAYYTIEQLIKMWNKSVEQKYL